jgi:lysophospholipid acyltransferase (LPLAT)-like uncharacterized protein
VNDVRGRTPRNTIYQQQTSSTRKLSRWRRRLYRIAAPVAFGLVRFWWWSCRVEVRGAEHLDAAAALDGPVIPVYWHGQQLFCVKCLLDYRARGIRLGFLISPSVDGEVPAMLAARGGAVVIRGSSSNTGARALRDYLDALRDGVSPGITPDGPAGPREEFKQGPVLLAQLSGRPMLPMAMVASRGFHFRSWDRFLLPYPFARVVVAIGPALAVPKMATSADKESWQTRMRDVLRELESTARQGL